MCYSIFVDMVSIPHPLQSNEMVPLNFRTCIYLGKMSFNDKILVMIGDDGMMSYQKIDSKFLGAFPEKQNQFWQLSNRI